LENATLTRLKQKLRPKTFIVEKVGGVYQELTDLWLNFVKNLINRDLRPIRDDKSGRDLQDVVKSDSAITVGVNWRGDSKRAGDLGFQGELSNKLFTSTVRITFYLFSIAKRHF
tara:strand:- start:548 stop:889 length:342 start_codon:yes stop_codon:yes gene_type:complete